MYNYSKKHELIINIIIPIIIYIYTYYLHAVFFKYVHTIVRRCSGLRKADSGNLS